MENPQLEIGYGTPRGDSDFYVNTLNATSYPTLNWKAKELDDTFLRRVLRLPIYIKATTEWRETPTMGKFFGLPAFTDLFNLTLLNGENVVFRDAPITPVFLTLVKDGMIHLQPGETAFVLNRLALFDLKDFDSEPVSAILTINRKLYPDVFATNFSYWKLNKYSVDQIIT